MDVLLRKSPFCPELTQILDLEETETHYGLSLQKISNSMHGIKSATLEIANMALFTPCMEFEKFCGQIPSFEAIIKIFP